MKSLSYFYILVTLLLFCSCDGWKWDENGDLDGMWQMTEWRDKSTGEVKATNENGYYLCIQLKMAKFQEARNGKYYLADFTNTGDSLFFSNLVLCPDEEKVPMTDIGKYGIPGNGHLGIDVLNGKNLVLSTQDVVLRFRKY